MNSLIQEHYGFIIKVVSETTHRYVNVQADDSFSIGLQAFEEAVQKYDASKGAFLSFVKLVIRSRVIDFMRKELREPKSVSLDALHEEGQQFVDTTNNDEVLVVEIENWKAKMAEFEISLEELVAASPRHQDTRQRAIAISEHSSQHPPITTELYAKKRLPVRLTARYNQVSEKVIKGSKLFITATIVIFKEEMRSLVDWIKR